MIEDMISESSRLSGGNGLSHRSCKLSDQAILWRRTFAPPCLSTVGSSSILGNPQP